VLVSLLASLEALQTPETLELVLRIALLVRPEVILVNQLQVDEVGVLGQPGDDLALTSLFGERLPSLVAQQLLVEMLRGVVVF